MSDRQAFGAFLKGKRKDRGITIRSMADNVGVAAGYYCDIESGRRSPIGICLLDKAIEVLKLTEADRQTLYDLAGKARSAAPPDLTQYINGSKAARVALRAAREKASDEDWLRFLGELERKG